MPRFTRSVCAAVIGPFCSMQLSQVYVHAMSAPCCTARTRNLAAACCSGVRCCSGRLNREAWWLPVGGASDTAVMPRDGR